MSETPAKPLSEKPLGYALAAAGGFPAAVFRVAPDAEGLRLLVNDSTYFAIQ